MTNEMQTKRNIMIIDDETMTLKLTKRGLEKLGYDVAIFSKPDEAIQFFKENTDLVSLVVSDKNMPKIDGLEILKIFKELAPEVPFFILSGFVDNNQDKVLKESGADKILMKPLSIKSLAYEVELVLSN